MKQISYLTNVHSVLRLYVLVSLYVLLCSFLRALCDSMVDCAVFFPLYAFVLNSPSP